MTTAPTREELLATLAQERTALLALLPQFTDDQWYRTTRADGWTVHDIAAHIADGTYGLAMMVLGELPPSLKLDAQTGWMDVEALNAQLRQKNATLPREKVLSRLNNAIDQAQRAIDATSSMEAPGPYGEAHTRGYWLRQMVAHIGEHRSELEDLLREMQ